MPQLNPLPWFMILTSTWIIFLLTLPYKLRHVPSPRMTPQLKPTYTRNPWTWPWN